MTDEEIIENLRKVLAELENRKPEERGIAARKFAIAITDLQKLILLVRFVLLPERTLW